MAVKNKKFDPQQIADSYELGDNPLFSKPKKEEKREAENNSAKPETKETAKIPARRKAETPAGKSADTTARRTLLDELNDNKEPVEERRTVRQGIDIYQDQVERLNKVKYNLRDQYKKKVTISGMVREAIDLYLEQIERKLS